MNKAQLIEALADRLGDKKTASQAVEGVVDLIVRNVNKGEKVNITGFGVFEKRARAARTARNPRTGESVKVKKTNVPAFRPGTQFKEVVGGQRKLPRATASKTAGTRTTATRTATATRGTKASTRPATKTAGTRASSTKASTTKPRATKASTAKASTSKASTSRAKASTSRAATTRSTTTRSTTKAAPKRTAAKTAPKRKTTKK